jgi:hypothetical protein
MDVLEFISKSEWPVVAGVALWLLRQPFQRMMDRVNLTKIDLLGLRAEFKKVLDKVDLLAPEDRTKRSAKPKASSRLQDDQANDTAQVGHLGMHPTPEILVLETWADLEDVVQELSGTLPLSLRYPKREIDQVVRDLGLNSDEVSALLELRHLRNLVASNVDASVTTLEAMRFQSATRRLLTKLAAGLDATGRDE